MSPSPPANAKPPPLALPFILAIVIPLLYSLFCAPLFASGANPDANVGRLTVLVTSYDDGFIGALFTKYIASLSPGTSVVTNNGALPVTLPGITFVSNASYTPASLSAAVSDSDAWAAVYVSAGTSSRLLAALASSANAATYDSSAALHLVWDEARNNAVSAPRVAGPIRGLLSSFATLAATATTAQWISSGAPTSGFSSSTGTLAKLLAAPVSYTEHSLFPFTVPAFNIAITVGQILMCVFGLVITNFVFGPLSAHPFVSSASDGLPKSLRQLALILLLSCMIGGAFSTMLVGLAQTNNLGLLAKNYVSGVTFSATAASTFGGSVWAQIWATQWLESAIFALWLCLPAAAGLVQAAPALLAPLIIYNSISVNVDVSDAGFKFFYYAPMWHSSEIIRNVLFGTLPTKLSMHVGVHWLWFGVEVILFLLIGSVAAKRKAAAAAKLAANAKTIAIVAAEGAEAVTEGK